MYLPWMVFIILWPEWSAGADSIIVYKFTNVECTSNPKRVENISCYIKAINWNKAVAQIGCDLVLPLRNFSVRFEVFKKGYSNQYHPFLINGTFNACDIVAKRSFLSYGTLMYKLVKEYTNFNHSCPFENHLIVRNLSLNENLMPNFPLGIYLFSIKVTEGFADRPVELVGTIKLYAQVMEMLRNKNKVQPHEFPALCNN